MFAKEGEAVFRQRETATIQKLAQKSHQVISTGGGVATKEIDMQELRKKWYRYSADSYATYYFKTHWK